MSGDGIDRRGASKDEGDLRAVVRAESPRERILAGAREQVHVDRGAPCRHESRQGPTRRPEEVLRLVQVAADDHRHHVREPEHDRGIDRMRQHVAVDDRPEDRRLPIRCDPDRRREQGIRRDRAQACESAPVARRGAERRAELESHRIAAGVRLQQHRPGPTLENRALEQSFGQRRSDQ